MFKHFKGDLFGGITAGIVALPLALAFGVSSGLGPSAGLYGAIFIAFFAALFGGTNTQISGPTAPMTAVSMVAVASILALNNGELEKALPIILAVFLLAGLMQIGMGLLGLGKYIKYIPYPVVSGFMTAIGIIILITQVLPVLGYYPEDDRAYVQEFVPEAQQQLLGRIIQTQVDQGLPVLGNFDQTVEAVRGLGPETIEKEAMTLASSEASGVIGSLKALPRALGHIDWLEVALALSTILIIYGFKRVTTAIPSTLVALVLVTATAFALGLDYRPIQEIPTGLPIPHFEIFSGFSLAALTPYIFTALTLALLGSIDSLLTSVVADNMTKTKHNPKKELIGQGIGNSMAALFGGLPGAGATIRTVVNINAGGKTRLSGMVAGLLLLVTLLALGPVASQIPAAVLAGILVTVGIGVMDYKGLKAIPNLPKDIQLGPWKLSSDVVVMLVVMILSSVWNLVYAVGIGLILASLIFMKRIGDLSVQRSTLRSLKENGWPKDLPLLGPLSEKVFIKSLEGPLFFGSASEFQELANLIPPTAEKVVIRMGKVPYMDQSGLYAMEEVLLQLKQRGVEVYLVQVGQQPRYMLGKIELIPDLVPESHVFKDIQSCTEHLVEQEHARALPEEQRI